ncbi:KaiC/GvpD/RAD55 family RecA-like ATPase [Methanohalophilus levihalophilus]|uniref:RAD55 family ATPase n=1 Tax=Methanohalophilus levihalophilus TaxID=1431282 RepID=UPI001AE6983A|nr:ATPase domain-containing protein [Methanohalophilus levihalophilus]MBP2029589.1 KaiC/GvpD/RAD55 family RecA-like ATPase [Methanohalophilus levihalophilus]
MRFIDTVEGLNNIFNSDIPKGSIVLVTGVAGGLKSGLTFAMLSKYLEETEEKGLYITLEQSKDSHLKNMKSMGMELSENLQISDYSDYRLKFDEYSEDLLDVIGTNIMKYKEQEGESLSCVALDSLGALYSLMGVESIDFRKQLYHLFEPLRRENLTTFVIVETHDTFGGKVGMESYLADGIIELGIRTKDNSTKRYIQVRKMRATSHSMDPWILTVSADGIQIYKDTT